MNKHRFTYLINRSGIWGNRKSSADFTTLYILYSLNGMACLEFSVFRQNSFYLFVVRSEDESHINAGSFRLLIMCSFDFYLSFITSLYLIFLKFQLCIHVWEIIALQWTSKESKLVDTYWFIGSSSCGRMQRVCQNLSKNRSLFRSHICYTKIQQQPTVESRVYNLSYLH